MNFRDDSLEIFAERGAPSLPPTKSLGYVHHQGASIWYASHGAGPVVVLLHGGLGHSGNWSHEVPMLLEAGYRVLLIDSRGHGRSTRDLQPFTYELMASDVLAVMDKLQIRNAAFVGWSDGACIAMVLAIKEPERVDGVFFFGCNMDPSGTKEVEFTPILQRCITRHKLDYAQLSETPSEFEVFSQAVMLMMKTEPNYSAPELAEINVPVAIVQSEFDEFIKLAHAEYLARTIPCAELILLSGVSHFAPLQRPELFFSAVHGFLQKLKVS